jgi:type I restriction enzyme R subunit
MYVDKRLAGIQAVQTLSRLNRIHPLKEDTFVLDFVNDRDEIREAFKTYYEGAEIGDEVDPARLYAIKGELDAAGIYLDEEVARFCDVYFKPKQRQSALDHQAMNAALDPAVSRFKARSEESPDEAELWRGKAAGVPEPVRLPQPGDPVPGLGPRAPLRVRASSHDEAPAPCQRSGLPVR